MKSRFWRLTLKEIRETLRDRRTVGTLVLMPLLVYPLLGIILQKFLFTQLGNEPHLEYRVGTETVEDAQLLKFLYQQGGLLQEKNLNSKNTEKSSVSENTPTEDQPLFNPEKWSVPQIGLVFQPQQHFPSTLREQLESGKIDLIVKINRSPQTTSGTTGDLREKRTKRFQFPKQQLDLEVEYLPGVRFSENALYMFQENLSALNQEFIKRFLASHDIDHLPIEMKLVSVEGMSEAGNVSIATIVPLILILMTVTGAVYPAIDLTAGERERQTLEALIAAPISRLSLLQAKYIAVLTVAFLTAMINLVSMLGTIHLIGVAPLVFGDGGLSWLLGLEILGLLTVFASFFSAVLLGVTSFARSFKEAQAYLIPLMLLSLAPGVFCLLPGFELKGVLAVVPLVNIVLLGRDLFSNNLEWQSALVVITSTLIYAWGALYVAARIFGTDAILYGSAGNWSDLWNSAQKRRDYPPFTSGLLCLAVLFPSFIYLSRIGTRLSSDGIVLDMLQRSLISVAVTVLLFVVIPTLFTMLMNSLFRKTYAFQKSRWSFFLAGVLLACSLWPFIYELEILLLPQQSIERLTEHFNQFKDSFRQLSLGWKLFCYAMIPAVCEEYFFRGYLFGATRQRFSGVATIFITAALFGLFHTLTEGILYERFFPSFALGLVLGIIRLRSGSLFPGILFHMLHNGLLLTISNYEQELQAWGLGTEQKSHLPLWLLATAGAVALTGAIILLRSSADRKSVTSEQPLPPAPSPVE